MSCRSRSDFSRLTMMVSSVAGSGRPLSGADTLLSLSQLPGYRDATSTMVHEEFLAL